MYLKSIEIQGFKSFANRIVFEFHDGITAIVGPNGSGKSNVADAVRWVLGEQSSRQLRGSSMQDVIFSGTEQRKPQGYAYVAITLDNTDHSLPLDYDEVMISRRLYRSGESEYRINQNTCRLRDINELFYDTGIGKEGYSIIGQGQIDQILSDRPEERRELFDEAAGIVKFKRRKAVTQKRLDNERQNLVRVRDVLAELERQLGPLKEQSETARKYLIYRDELKKNEVNLFLLESDQTDRQLKEAASRAEILQNDMTDAKALAEDRRLAFEELEKKSRSLDESLTDIHSKASQAELSMETCKGQIALLEEQIKNEEQRSQNVKDRLTAIETDMALRRQQKESYQKDNEELLSAVEADKREKMAAEYDVAQKDNDIYDLENKIEENKTDIIKSLNDKAALAAELKRYETLMEQAQTRKAEISQRLLKAKSDDAVMKEELESGRQELLKVQEHLKELRDDQTAAESEAERLELDMGRLNDSLLDARQSYNTAKTRHDSLQNIAERYEGYGSATRKVMELSSTTPGILGVVADLITVDKKYETAIETALGGSIQNVVTDSEATAKKCIEYLKKNRYGRQTFLPLDAIKGTSPFSRPEVLRERGVIGLASSLVKTTPEFDILAEYLLGRVVVADNIDSAIAIAQKYKHSLRIVTLEGELFNAGGSLTGGTYKNSSNLLGRRRELEELEKICSRASKQIEELTSAIEKEQVTLAAKRDESKALLDMIHEESIRENTLSLNLENSRLRQEEARESDNDLLVEKEQIDRQIADIDKNSGELKKQSDELDKGSVKMNREAETFAADLERARKARDEAAAKLEEINLNASSRKQKADFVLENIKRIDDETRRLKEESETLTAGSGDSERVLTEKHQDIERLNGETEKARAEKERFDAEAESISAEKDETAAKQKEALEERDAANERVTALDRDLVRVQSQQEKLEEKLETQVSQIWDEYGLTPVTAAELRDEDMLSASAYRKKTDELKRNISQLGTVNVNAIDDYKTVSERYGFMKDQCDDLEKAEAELADIIDELDSGMRKQFEEKFREIQKEFNRVFRELFGGGSGTLDLVADTDILEAGIQIIAQPPGKKLQNMMQLSGGEKALTAIALLFAIQNLKPSPFCLLDEIEAALDDSNVDRFAQYLKKLSARTQFIVITHRRGTMVAADRLYGITMQEKGISALVSVSLIEDQLDA